MRTLGKQVSIRTAASVSAALVLTQLSCSPQKPCDDVVGSCLELRIEANGSYTSIEGALVGATGDLKKGDLPNTAATTFPTVVRMVPPTGVNSSAITAVRIDARSSGVITASGTTVSGFSWPEGSHVTATVQLSPVTPVEIPPGPLLKWNVEPSTATAQLYDVYAYSNAGSDFVIAAGQNGTVLSRTMTGSWVAESSGTTALFAGLFGAPQGNIFGVTQATTTPMMIGAVWKRDSASPFAWTKESMPMPIRKGFWCAAAGVAAGELWAGDDDGMVWHRAAGGTWTSEQALPSGIGVYGIAQAEGAIFAVGDVGNVAYRPNSNAGTNWVKSQITANVLPTDWFNGVWAFDKNYAVAVGTNGLFARFTNGVWVNAATKIDTNNTELFGAWGLSQSRVWIVGRNGLILRVDDQKTYKLYSQMGVDLQAIYGLSDSNIYVVGGNATPVATIIHGTP